MPEQKLNKHLFIFNKDEQGGGQLILETQYIDNGDSAHGLPDGVFTNQTLTLMSYGNSAIFNLCGDSLNPENLRELADQLEKAEKEAYRLATLK